jgi:hypothetical protein
MQNAMDGLLLVLNTDNIGVVTLFAKDQAL